MVAPKRPLINIFSPRSDPCISLDASHDTSWVRKILIRLFDDHGLVAVVNGGPVKKFLKISLKAISLRAGTEIPGLQKILPANTYLITVPPASTTISVAKVVMDRCAAGGDSAGEPDSEPIPVKVRRTCVLVQSPLQPPLPPFPCNSPFSAPRFHYPPMRPCAGNRGEMEIMTTERHPNRRLGAWVSFLAFEPTLTSGDPRQSSGGRFCDSEMIAPAGKLIPPVW